MLCNIYTDVIHHFTCTKVYQIIQLQQCLIILTTRFCKWSTINNDLLYVKVNHKNVIITLIFIKDPELFLTQKVTKSVIMLHSCGQS